MTVQTINHDKCFFFNTRNERLKEKLPLVSYVYLQLAVHLDAITMPCSSQNTIWAQKFLGIFLIELFFLSDITRNDNTLGTPCIT